MTTIKPYDVLIIGGGINGVSIAREAAMRGLSVKLCEKNDLASGTSSASSKLIHGGLRYLSHGHFNLVREALNERNTLLRLAPHLVKPLAFLYPCPRNWVQRYGMRCGLWLYDHMSLPRPMPVTHTKKIAGLKSSLPLHHSVKQAFCYYDAVTNDARLVIVNAIAAKTHGAAIANYTEVRHAEPQADCWHVNVYSSKTKKEEVIRARVVINAAGPWGPELNHQLLQVKNTMATLVKGSHLIVKKLYDAPYAYTLPVRDGRVLFVIPYQDNFHLIGTTEIVETKVYDQPKISTYEIAYLMKALAEYTPLRINDGDIISSFAGWRVLMRDDECTSRRSRECVIDLNQVKADVPWLTVYGGKLTSHRSIAKNVMHWLKPRFSRLSIPRNDMQTLPGGDFSGSLDDYIQQLQINYPFLSNTLCRRYAATYGTLCEYFLQGKQHLNELGADHGYGLYQAEVDYLRAHEWAQSDDDILWRRTKIGLLKKAFYL